MSFYTMRLMIELILSLHFFLRLRLAFGGGWWQLPVLLWTALMLAPMLMQGAGVIPRPLMDILTQVWPIWLGYLILFFVVSLCFDFLHLGTGLAGSVCGHKWWSILAGKRTVPVTLVFALLASFYAYYEAHHPSLVKIEIFTGKMPEGIDTLRIVQLTDVHLGRFIGLSELENMIRLVREADPDILVVTGDLVDGDMSTRAKEAALLASIKPRLGTWAVLGNHEKYAGGQNSLDFYQKAGLRLLRGQAGEIGGLVVAGLDDEVFGDAGNKEPIDKILAKYRDDGRFVLLLKHRPALAPGTGGLFDLQLSGHTHGGQIWPGHLLAQKANGGILHGLNYQEENSNRRSASLNPPDEILHGLTHKPSNKNAVYTSRGAGFWGLPMRFLAPPEVTLIELKRIEAISQHQDIASPSERL